MIDLNDRIALLIDYTKSLDENLKNEFIKNLLFSNIVNRIELVVLYGIRPYPLCNKNCIITKKLRDILWILGPLDGPPEPFRAVKEAIEYSIQSQVKLNKIILIWSAPRKPLVDLRIAFNLAESVGSDLYLILTRTHSSRWLTKALQNLEPSKVILPSRGQSPIRIIRRLIGEV